MKEDRSSKRVLIYGFPFQAYERGFLMGIMRYAHRPARWIFSLHESQRGLQNLVRAWKPQGMLFQGEVSPSFAHFVRTHRLPVVGVGWPVGNAFRCCVRSDEEAAGRMATDHLIEHGFRNLGFYGGDEPFVAAQRHGFMEAARKAGATPRVLQFHGETGARFSFEKRIREIASWLDGASLPFGIVIARDGFAPRVMQACGRKGLRIPEDVAVIGVGDDEVFSDMVRPALSIVARNAQRVGYEAAAMLDRLMRGKSSPGATQLIPPSAILTRGSTDTLAVDDKRIVAALRLIRDRCPEPVTVSEAAEHAHMSRRSFEQHFRKTIGRSPAAEIRRQRIEHAKKLLRETNQKVATVAEACHFKSDKDFWSVFRRVVGTSPQEYRRSKQGV